MKERTGEYLLKDIEKQKKRVAIRQGIPKDVRKAISTIDSVIMLGLTVLDDDGIYKTTTGIRSRDALPSGGGWRIEIVIDITEALFTAKFLSILMSDKLAIGGEDCGGAKAFLILDPRTPLPLQYKFSEEFGRKMAPYMIMPLPGGKFKLVDRIAPDKNTNHMHMEYFLKGVKSVLGGIIPDNYIRSLATGKEPNGTPEGGLLGRPESTGWGIVKAAELGMGLFGLNLKGATIAIHGFGKVGIPAAERAVNEYGAKVVAVSDSKGGIVNWSGLDVGALKKHKKEKGTVMDFPGTTHIASDDLLELEVDILMPSATEGKITSDNADKIKAKYVISEGSNKGMTDKAEREMSKRGIIVLDGTFANVYGVKASMIEAAQNRDGRLRTFEEVMKKLDDGLEDSFREILIRAKKYEMNLPDAMLAYANEKIIKMKLGKTLEEILAERAGK